MQKLTVLVLLAAFAVSVAPADPALGGGRGLWRVQDARVEEDGALVFANRWMFNREAFRGDSSIWRGPLFGMELSYAPVPFIEVFGSLIGVAEFKTGPNRLYYDWQGQALGAKLSLPFLPVLKLAGSGHWTMARDDYYFADDGFMDGLWNEGKSWRAIGALRFADLYKTLPTLMFNYGQSLEDEGGQFAGVGIEFSSDAIDVFVEATSEIPEDQEFKAFIGDGYTPRARVSPGVRIRIPYFHINGGVEIGITDSVPDYEAILGFCFVSPFPKPRPKPWGRLAGKVVDARTRMPLNAVIRSPNRRFKQRKTDAENGIFFLQKAPVGVVVVEATAEGYIPEAVPLVITDKGYANHTFELRPLVPYGTVAGRTYNQYSGEPLAAQVSFAGMNLEPTTSNEVTGFFRVDNVPAGLVSVLIEKDGFFAEQRVIEIEDGGLTKLNVGLAPLDMKGTYSGKVVDRKTGETLAASINFVDSKRARINTDAETGEFETELPVGLYEVEVEAPGYLPQTSTFNIEKAETTTRVYEMVSKGMVLTLKGVYFELGKSKLRTESYPALTEAAQIMKANPDIRVEIQGHTCSIGSDESNQKLSEKRAYAVVNFLVQYGGVDPKRLTAKGYGEGSPIAPNDTDEGRQLNRRVDFVILK
jgi:outer membrane protein OmpA-like peptidoglycan-associated protein